MEHERNKTAAFAGVKIGFAVTGSFCTHGAALAQAERLAAYGAELIPILSEKVQTVSTRFGSADEFAERIAGVCGRDTIRTVDGAEPLGPKRLCDVMAVVPCTGNTIAKLANSITDGVVTMAVKSCIRGGTPVVIAAATNDALAGSMKNIGLLMNYKPYYFVPVRQDDWENKPFSLVADFELLPETVEHALRGKQLQPLFGNALINKLNT